MWSNVSRPSSRSSGIPRQSSGNVRHPPGNGSSGPWNHDGSIGSASSSRDNAEKGSERPSRTPRVLATLVTILYIHVRSDDRASNVGRPLRMPIHASWTASSATARDETYIWASRSIAG